MTDAFCSFVRDALDGKPISEAASQVGVTDQTIKNWLGRRNVPSAKVWATFVNRLGLTPEEKAKGWEVWAKAARVQAEGTKFPGDRLEEALKQLLPADHPDCICIKAWPDLVLAYEELHDPHRAELNWLHRNLMQNPCVLEDIGIQIELIRGQGFDANRFSLLRGIVWNPETFKKKVLSK